MRRAAALILGGGPAGSAAAITLARDGAIPLVLERNHEGGDALCGGFLSWRTLEALGRLGLARETLGGHAIARLRLFSGTRTGEVALPGPAIGLSRHRLDALLLAEAERRGAQVERGVAVQMAEPGAVRLSDGGAIACNSLFLATGKHDCRGLARPRDLGGADPALGLRIRIAAAPALSRMIGGAIELHLFRGGYAGLLLQEDGSGNLCMAIHKSRLSEAGGDVWALLDTLAAESPPLGERIALADRRAPVDAIGSVPYGWRATNGVAGLFRLGDQAAVIPSLAGEGIGIALQSGVMAARHHLAGGPASAPDFQAELARATWRPVALAGWIGRAGESGWGRRIAPALLAGIPGLAAMLARFTRIGP